MPGIPFALYSHSVQNRTNECGLSPVFQSESPTVKNSNRNLGPPRIADEIEQNMSEHQKDTDFLRCLINYGDTEEHRELENRIAQVQRDERCVRRVILAAALFTLTALVGLVYTAILDESFPYDQSPTVITILCDVGLASLICLAGLVVLLVVYRIRLNGLREECRHSVKSLIEFQLNKSRVMAPRHDRSDPADAEIARRSPVVADFPEKVGSGER
jgi:hypothetical protein